MNPFLQYDQDLTLFINGSNSLLWDRIIYLATQTVTWIPIALLMLYVVFKNGGTKQLFTLLGLLFLGIFLSDQLSSSIVKPMVQRFRPTQDPHLMYLVDVVNNYRGGRYGFFSAHASNTFTVAMLLAYRFHHKRLTLLLFSWALLNCYTRIYLGVHYAGDVLVGIAVGLLIGGLLNLLQRHLQPPTQKPLPATTPTGYNNNQMNMLSSCILLNYGLLFIVALFE